MYLAATTQLLRNAAKSARDHHEHEHHDPCAWNVKKDFSSA
jgi:hypothetical protein